MSKTKTWHYCVVGNIVKEHIDENGILRHGTSAFSGRTKVYLCGKNWDERLPQENKTEIAVLGLCRGKRYYVASVPIELIENVRLSRVYTPKILEIMSNFEFVDGWWGNSKEDRDDAETFVKQWRKLYKAE